MYSKEGKQMFNILSNMINTTVKAAINIPVAVVNDVATLGGSLNGKDVPHTIEAVEDTIKDLQNLTK